MRQSDWHHQLELAGRKLPPRLGTIYALGLLAVFMTVVLAFKARWAFSHPFPNSMIDAERWYDHLLGALIWASVAGSCFVYVRYRARLTRANAIATARPWRLRHEVRFVVYALAATLLLRLPIGVFRAIVALGDGSTPAFVKNFVSVFPVEALIYPLVGAAIVLYDRRCVTREARQAGNLCPACGYDLRASPIRCPECGTPARSGHPAGT
jgi:hypothetical protein